MGRQGKDGAGSACRRVRAWLPGAQMEAAARRQLGLRKVPHHAEDGEEVVQVAVHERVHQPLEGAALAPAPTTITTAPPHHLANVSHPRACSHATACTPKAWPTLPTVLSISRRIAGNPTPHLQLTRAHVASAQHLTKCCRTRARREARRTWRLARTWCRRRRS